MTKVLTGLAVALALMFSQASPATAQTAAPAAQPAEFEAKAALVRRYFEVIQFEKLMNVSMESMMATMLADTGLPEDKYQAVETSVLEAFAVVMPQMIEASVAMYAEAFTLEELEGLVTFYESPIGRSVMVKAVVLSRNSGDLLARFQPVMEEETLRRLCARIECPAVAGAPEPTAKRR